MATAMLVQPDRKILVAGKSADGKGGNDLALMRYFADGILDTSFGDAGSKVIPLGAAVNRCNAAKRLALQADGKILVLTNIG